MHKFTPGYLKEKRLKSGLNHYQLERKIRAEIPGKKITHMTIKRVEEGAVDPQISTVLTICAALNIAPAGVFKRMENGSHD